MSWKKYTVLPLLSALLLTACGVNNDANETAFRNDRTTNELQRVRYFPGDETGAAGSNTNFHYHDRYHNTGPADERIQRNLTYDTDIGNRNVIDDRKGTINGTRVNERLNENNESRIAVADRAAEKVAALKEVSRANVFVTENNAYVAVQLENNVDEKKRIEIEKRISDIVKSTDRDIDRVNVSVNPDFFDRTASYADDIRNGRPVTGLAEEFTNLIQRVFPTER